MKKISGFDLGMIIAFAVVTLLGGAAWWYFSGELAATQAAVADADSKFEQYSSKEVYLPTAANEKILHANIDLMQSQLDPLVQSRFQASGNKLPTAAKEDTVAWKHDLDAEVSRLNTAAKLHGVTASANFYYGFSRYLNQNPGDEQTAVLSKQLYGVEEIANIFINAPVRAIYTFRRTYEEDPVSTNPNSNSSSRTDPDILPGNAVTAPGDVYTAYPFEIEFEASTLGFRKIVADLQKSPYVFVIRTVAVQNSNPTSPQISDLDKLAGAPANSDAGDAGTKASKGPQYLFGNETLHIKAHIDMIEWHGVAKEEPPGAGNRPGGGGNNRPGGVRGSNR